MSIYNYSVLKSNPLKINIIKDGIPITILAYRIKWHGKDTWFEDLAPWVKKKWWPRKYDFESTYDLLKDRAKKRWGKDRPEYGIATPGYEGKLDFNDPHYKDKGLAIFKIDGLIAWQEDDGFKQFIGSVKKDGRTIKFIEAPTEEKEIII